MTNREYLNTLSDDDFAEWLCGQIWEQYVGQGLMDSIRYNTVRNFLKMEHEEEADGHT